MAVQGDRAVAGHLHKAQIGTFFARPCVIPAEHAIALRASEQIVAKEFPDDGPAGRGRINDTRVTLR